MSHARIVDVPGFDIAAGASSPAADPRTWAKYIEQQLRYHFTKGVANATAEELFRSAAATLRPILVDALLETSQRFQSAGAKSVYYVSMEFLLGRSLANNLQNLNLYNVVADAFSSLGIELSDVLEAEPDAALGNGGLGRLAACFLDSLASLHMPGYGYGINYEFGLFRQEFQDGRQKEHPDYWASARSPWLIERLDESLVIPLYGRVEHSCDRDGNYNPMWLDWQVLISVPHDVPVVGHGGGTVNFLRLFSARASDEFDIGIFNAGDYLRAVEQKIQSETVSKVLYPSDSIAKGQELRLIQEYFLVASAVRDIVRRHLSRHSSMRNLASGAAIQLNDTHPALTVAELMRTLVDEHALAWDEAWEITRATCSYTNHTLMPEALERWSLSLVEKVLPRHLQIIYEINHRFLREVECKWPGDTGRQNRMSLIEETPVRMVRMANLAIVGSHAINGVAAIHSELVKSDLVPDFYSLFPERFSNKTNGITPRRWLMHANADLCAFITDRIGEDWRHDLSRIVDLDTFAEDVASQRAFLAVKERNKNRLAAVIAEKTGIFVDTQAMFDVQIKRMHEYKRQLLHALGIIDEYLGIVEDNRMPASPRVHIFGGKAAPGYFAAKLIIKLIHNIASVVNADPCVRGALKLVFLPDYKVSLAEVIIPAADLSEQISTAGTEASGTGNMKLALNGALTIGTLDGANIEILDAVGHENMFIFGLKTPEVADLRTRGYNPRRKYEENPRIRRIVDSLARFSQHEPGIFDPIRRILLDDGDHYMHLADLPSYLDAQHESGVQFSDRLGWSQKAIRNVARVSRFSSDRTIHEYASGIWDIAPFPPAKRLKHASLAVSRS
jgi:glycogen phosphorylase